MPPCDRAKKPSQEDIYVPNKRIKSINVDYPKNTNYSVLTTLVATNSKKTEQPYWSL